MKKGIVLIAICMIFIITPVTGALTLEEKSFDKEAIQKEDISKLTKPSFNEYDGTILGGLGRLFKENEEWNYNVYSYLAGVYKEKDNHKTIYCNIYNLDKEKIGTLRAYCGHSIIIGSIKNLDEGKAPIVGFLFENEEKFAGRIMSLFGPAPHIWGKYESK